MAPGLALAANGQDGGMTEQEWEPEEDEAGEDPLLEAQEGKGYGEDEGEREGSLEDE